MMKQTSFITAAELAAMLGVSVGHAYQEERNYGNQAFGAISDVPGKVLQKDGGAVAHAGAAGGSWLHPNGRAGAFHRRPTA